MLPGKVWQLDEGWPRFVAAYEELHARLQAIEPSDTQRDRDQWVRACPYARDLREDAERIRKAARGIVEQLVDLAERSFAGAGLRLTIDAGLYIERFAPERQRRDEVRSELDVLADFRPAAVWRQLESDYGNGAGEREAFAQAAAALLSALGLRYRHARDRVKTTPRGAEFNLFLRHEAFRSGGNGYALSYHSCETVTELCRGLAGFFQWTAAEEGEDVSSECRAIEDVRRLRESNVSYRSRQRIAETASWSLTMYKDHGVLSVSTARAAQLNLFLSLHGGLEDQHAA